MKHVNLAILLLLAGLTLMIPLSNGASDNQKSKITDQSIAGQSEKPASTQPLDEQQGPPINQSVQPGENPMLVPGMLIYKPPSRGTPGRRVGGGSRGDSCSIGNELLMLSVLAPDHVGLTVQEQPSLFWYLSKSTSCPVELTIIDDQAIPPVLETRLRSPVQPGVQRVRLADYGVHLSLGVLYQWFVAVVHNPDSPSKSIIAGDVLERIDLPRGLYVKLTQAGKAKAPYLYAEAGLWYDALAAISELIEAAPIDSVLRKQRASLLDQAGLPEIAEYDMRHGPSN